jgi:hypothetical protein
VAGSCGTASSSLNRSLTLERWCGEKTLIDIDFYFAGFANLPVANTFTALFWVCVILCLYEPFRLKLVNTLAHPTPTTKLTFASLDTLRGLAALWVFLGHSIGRATPLLSDLPVPLQIVMQNGSLAVPVFLC